MTVSLQKLVVKCLLGAWQNRLRRGSALPADRVRELRDRLVAEKTALFSFTAAMEEEFLELGTLLRKITYPGSRRQDPVRRNHGCCRRAD